MIGGRFSGEFVGYAGLFETTSVEQLLDVLWAHASGRQRPDIDLHAFLLPEDQDAFAAAGPEGNVVLTCLQAGNAEPGQRAAICPADSIHFSKG